MSRKSKWEYFKAIYHRYHQASKATRQQILDEFCQVCGYHRKYAIRLLNGPLPQKNKPRSRRRPTLYGPQVISLLAAIWQAAGYPWSVRLKALLPLWLPCARKHLALTPALERQLLSISPATIDRRLKIKKHQLKKNLYGRTKPGTLLKHHIPIKTDHWDVSTPGFTEVDLVSHSGSASEGEFIHSLNQTDIHTTWVETRAVLGKAQHRVKEAMDEMRLTLPFKLLGIDSDNGSEFINDHLYRYCQDLEIQFTRGRAYKKDDNAHIEQKNWTHVRKLLGYVRYDSQQALDAINDLYRNELRIFKNLFQPSVKLAKKVRLGSKLKRLYEKPQTPFQRVCDYPQANPDKVAQLKELQKSLDPFELSRTIDQKLERIYQMANHRRNAQS
ncbi:MAG: integrase [Nitrospiria bacterium]